MKKFYTGLALFSVLMLLVVGCGSTTPVTGANQVGMNSADFAKSSITIKKGESITLVNYTSTTHIIANGFWHGNTPDPKVETSAPVVDNVIFSSLNQTQTVGPFATAGTYHYYCTVHIDMNLTVIVQ
jgi:plastocyanin